MKTSLPFLAALLLASASMASAQTVIYSQGFDSPSGANGDVYFSDSATYNGITDGTSSGGITTGGSFAGNGSGNGQIRTSVPTGSFGPISGPQGGTYFLYENTNSGLALPNAVWAISGLTVTANTNYVLSFYMTNQDTTNVASIQPFVNGTSTGPSLSATGTNTWQQFTVNWNSGAATTASLELDDSNLNIVGNDFAIDTIQVTTVPEPREWAMMALALVMGLVFAQRTLERFRREAVPCRAS